LFVFSVWISACCGLTPQRKPFGYRQTNLASDLPNVANNITPGLVNPWGIAFLSDQPFFISDNRVGRVTAHDATGLGVVPGSFIVPNAAWIGFDTPTGIVADQNSFFGSPSLIKPFICGHRARDNFHVGPSRSRRYPTGGNICALEKRRRLQQIY